VIGDTAGPDVSDELDPEKSICPSTLFAKIHPVMKVELI
jgi:hypothetical protein